MKIIDTAVVKCLENGKRLVIPTLGAFLRKDGDGRIVFVEFLKKDDGVLSSELVRTYGLSATEALEAIESFALAVRRGASQPGGYAIDGLGTMHTDAGGVLDLDYAPQTKAAASKPIERSAANAPAAAAPTPAEAPRVPSGEPAGRPTPAQPQPAPAANSASGATGASGAANASGVSGTSPGAAVPGSASPGTGGSNPASQSPAAPNRPAAQAQPGPAAPVAGASRPAAVSATHPHPGAEVRPTPSATETVRQSIERSSEPVKVERGPASNPSDRHDLVIKNMRYQKPAKETPDYRKKKADMIMVIAIIAATIAIAAMIYGMLGEKNPSLNMRQPAPTEQAATDQ